MRVKVFLVHGRRVQPDRTASVAVRPTVEAVAEPKRDRRDLELVRRWIVTNRDGDLLTDEAIAPLKPLAPP